MLRGTRSPYCERCYEQEQAGFRTLRQAVNKTLRAESQAVLTTNPSGELPFLNVVYLDIRPSNLCNFCCRTCGPDSSSRWAAELFGDTVVRRPTSDSKSFIALLEPLLRHVRRVYFAGGEPLIMDEHYELLELLLELGRHDVHLAYNTNLSRLSHRGWRVIDLWRMFPNVYIGASLDDFGSQGEYLRKGLCWKRAVDNRLHMLVACPHVRFQVNITVSVFNVLRVPTFHRACVDAGLISWRDINLNILQRPPWYRVTTLPKSHKQEASRRFVDHIRFLTDSRIGIEIVEMFQAVVRFMNLSDTSAWLPEFRSRTLHLDRVRGEALRAVYPELVDLLNTDATHE